MNCCRGRYHPYKLVFVQEKFLSSLYDSTILPLFLFPSNSLRSLQDTLFLSVGDKQMASERHRVDDGSNRCLLR